MKFQAMALCFPDLKHNLLVGYKDPGCPVHSIATHFASTITLRLLLAKFANKPNTHMVQPNSRPYSSVRISTKSGPLAQIWLAANMSNLPKISVLQTRISESAEEIAKASGCDDGDVHLERITLHTSGDLLQGIVRVYSKQAAFLLTDIKDTLMKISTLFRANQRINVSVGKANTITSIEQLVLQDTVTEREVLALPSLDFLQDAEGGHGMMRGDDSMRRKVQGAAPWDTSLEVGRRFNPDDSLDHNRSSVLDLDFDFEHEHASSSSKTWEEGTRQTALEEASAIRGEPGQLIGDDDFPLDDPTNGHWDLGITENDHPEDRSESPSNMSVELGRRADDASMLDEVVDLGIDLGIEKEPIEEVSAAEEEQANDTAPPARRSTRKSELVNARRIEIDDETELDDAQIKEPTVYQPEQQERMSNHDTTLSRKRVLDELNLNIGYLPSLMLENIVSYQQIKKQKPTLEEEEDDEFSEPQMNITLGLDDDMISRDKTMESDADQSDHFMPMDADIGMPIPTQEDMAGSPNSGSISREQSIQPGHTPTEQTQEQRLVASEAPSTVYMAELLRTEFIDNDNPTFDDVLKVKNQAETPQADGGITRGQASKAFFELLSLANVNCIDLDQQVAFENINIHTKPLLFEKFIAV